ncbi:MAG: hypothetical protein HQL05_11785 [Nitrospirae bacterium]|nr:hypothetical protein [Nitrospirota bacterium]
MLAKPGTSITALLTLFVFMCVSCVSEAVRREGGGGQERFYKGQQAEIVDLLRQSRQEMLNNNLDNAMSNILKAMEKSKAIKDDTMRLSCGFWVMVVLSNAGKPISIGDSVPIELLMSDNFESLFYGYLLVMYDINAFDLRGKDSLEMLYGLNISGKSKLEFGTLNAEELRKAGESKFAVLADSMLKSYKGLLEAFKNKDNNKVNEYKRKVADSCDKIVLLTDDYKMFQDDDKYENEEVGIMMYMERILALQIKLIVAGSDRDMAAYEKAAKKYAEAFAMMMPK